MTATAQIARTPARPTGLRIDDSIKVLAHSVDRTSLTFMLGVASDMKPPICPIKIANRKGVRVIRDEAGEMTDGAVGWYRHNPRDGIPEIVITPDMERHRERFVIAHELAHHVFCREGRPPDTLAEMSATTSRISSISANFFAMSVLMPAPIFLDLIARCEGSRVINVLSSAFNVSESAAFYRMQMLGVGSLK